MADKRFMRDIFEELREYFPLKVETSPLWANTALEDFNAFLVDHASCERKASATCMSFVGGYPEKLDLCDVMITLAREELEHFQQVFRVLKQRGLSLDSEKKDPYVNELLKLQRNSKDERFMDRLLISGIVEARSCERLGIVGKALLGRIPECTVEPSSEDKALGQYYDDLAVAEARHYGLFTKFAERYFSKQAVHDRQEKLLDAEAQIVEALPWRAAVH